MRTWRTRIVVTLSVFGAIFLGCLAYAYFVEPNRLVATHATITIDKWNPAFDGLKIVMIGDVHGGSNNVTEEKLRQVVALANEQEPDLVVLLGDYISQKLENRPLTDRSLKMPVATIADNLAGLRAKYGVFVVMGNHDGWYGTDRIAAEFTRVGYRVLQDQVVTIGSGDQSICILGMRDHLSLVDSWATTSANATAQVAGCGDGDLIVLQHSPDVFPIITGPLSISPNLRLMLSAHTHGGQVTFPVVGSLIVPSSYGQEYVRGHVREDDVDLFVTSGIGTSVLPLRFGVPPEIAVLTIRSQ
jgi:hypothetical protein